MTVWILLHFSEVNQIRNMYIGPTYYSAFTQKQITFEWQDKEIHWVQDEGLKIRNLGLLVHTQIAHLND